MGGPRRLARWPPGRPAARAALAMAAGPMVTTSEDFGSYEQDLGRFSRPRVRREPGGTCGLSAAASVHMPAPIPGPSPWECAGCGTLENRLAACIRPLCFLVSDECGCDCLVADTRENVIEVSGSWMEPGSAIQATARNTERKTGIGLCTCHVHTCTYTRGEMGKREREGRADERTDGRDGGRERERGRERPRDRSC